MKGVPRLFLIDSFGFIFRAYHARARSGAPPMRTAAGFRTEAVYIFHNMVRRLKTQRIRRIISRRFSKARVRRSATKRSHRTRPIAPRRRPTC